MKEKRARNVQSRTLILFLVVFSVPSIARIIEHIPISALQLAFTVVNSVILTGFLAWLIPKIQLRRSSLWVLVWLELLVVGFLNDYVEGLFFTSMFDNPAVLVSSVTSAVISSAISATAGTLLLGHGDASITTLLKEHLAARRATSWIWRIVIGSAVYFPIYFLFGALITPFVLPYYGDPSFGLRIPSFTVMVPVELFRGVVYTLALLPLMAAVAGDRRTKFIALAATLYIPGGLIALLGNTLLPAQIIPFHAVEILADSIAYGFVLSRILGRPN